MQVNRGCFVTCRALLVAAANSPQDAISVSPDDDQDEHVAVMAPGILLFSLDMAHN